MKESSDGRSVRQIVEDIIDHVGNIIRSEVRLATVEIRQDIAYAAKIAVLLGFAAILMLFGFGFLLLSAMYALQQVLSLWAAALVVGLCLEIAAAILCLTIWIIVRPEGLLPYKTIQTLENNFTWLRRQTK